MTEKFVAHSRQQLQQFIRGADPSINRSQKKAFSKRMGCRSSRQYDLEGNLKSSIGFATSGWLREHLNPSLEQVANAMFADRDFRPPPQFRLVGRRRTGTRCRLYPVNAARQLTRDEIADRLSATSHLFLHRSKCFHHCSTTPYVFDLVGRRKRRLVATTRFRQGVFRSHRTAGARSEHLADRERRDHGRSHSRGRRRLVKRKMTDFSNPASAPS